MVSFSAVAKRFPGGKSALENVSFALEAGEMRRLSDDTATSDLQIEQLLKIGKLAVSLRPYYG